MIFIDNKYTRWYYGIIDRARARNFTSRAQAKTVLGYVERHHIIPKCMGGGEADNLVYLTAKEHFVCHHLLTKMTEGLNKGKMHKALHKMSNVNSFQQRTRIPPTLYERIRIEAGKAHSRMIKGTQVGVDNPMFGQRHSEDAKQRMSAAKIGKIPNWSAEGRARHGAAVSKAFKGVPKPESQRIALSKSWDHDARSGENHPMYGKTHGTDTKEKMRVASAARWDQPEEKAKLTAARANDPVNVCACGKTVKGKWNFQQHTSRCTLTG